MRRVVTSLSLVGLLWAAPAGADEPLPSNFEARPIAVYAQLGFGTPLGTAGLEVEGTVLRHLALSGGVGKGYNGPQVAFMPRLRFAAHRAAFTLGAGVSYGRYVWPAASCFDCAPASQGTVGWANFEPGFELRLNAGFSLRFFLGYGRVIVGELTCVEAGLCSTESAANLIYTGVGVGWSF